MNRRSLHLVEKRRLNKMLASCGVASRRAAEELIRNNKVRVNGKPAVELQLCVDPANDQVEVEGYGVIREHEKVYFMLHKPKGYLCSNVVVGRKRRVIDLFQHLPFRLFTVGRLDRDTTGLLLVTNDGHFAQQVIHPSYNLTKEYLVKTYEEITHLHLQKLSRGSRIEGKRIKPFSLSKVRRGTLKIGVKEGKKREVRLLIQNAGLSLVSLKRIRIGPLSLGSLPEGAFRPLKEGEAQALLRL